MQIGMIGLGSMGAGMATRLMHGGHECVVLDQALECIARIVALGARGAASLPRFVESLQAPRAVWLMVPAAAVDALLDQLMPLLQPGDIVIDGGNSHYHDDLRRAAALAASGIAHMDVGTSGGVAGLHRGYCLMIGGDMKSVRHLAPVFATLAPGAGAAVATPGRRVGNSSAEQGWLRRGPHGAGHFVKMVHNGIEYRRGVGRERRSGQIQQPRTDHAPATSPTACSRPCAMLSAAMSRSSSRPRCQGHDMNPA